MGLITETDYQYYEGQQLFEWGSAEYKCTFDTKMLDLGSNHPSNYFVEWSPTNPPLPNGWNLLNPGVDYQSWENVLKVTAVQPTAVLLRVTLVEQAKWDNYGGYEYIKLNDIINNFMVAYVGEDKIVERVKRSDVIFHAKRGLQEFSYDTLKSVNSMEIEVPPSLSFPIPHDYVNYVQLSWIDNIGIKHIIYPTNNLTSSPTEVPIQDGGYNALPIQDYWGENLEAQQSRTNERWRKANDRKITGELDDQYIGVYDWNWWKMAYGQRYGLEPTTTQKNGWFNIDERRGTFNFSSDLTGKLIMINYISDGLAYDTDMKVPKMAEEAMYMHILYSILSTKLNTPEYIVRRFKKERSSKLRNAKIRLSNIKLDAFTQVMRGKSKWLKN
tara:strand:- start:7422 stop:8576 length:1155 start_codon:yes stop_codon:yes gene_type:complete